VEVKEVLASLDSLLILSNEVVKWSSSSCNRFRKQAQRFMSKRAGSKVVEVKGSHAIYVSHPEAVAALIEQAAKA